MKRSLLPLMALALVGGCSTLPGDGPSGRAVVNGSAGPQQAGDYALVDLDYTVGEVIKAVPPRFSGSLAAGGADTPVDVLGIGDTLAVSIYEPSGALFGTRNMSRDIQTGTQALPPLVVDRSGAVNVPFAGRVHVEGLTGPEAADAIKRALRGKVGNPQVVAYIAQNPSNAITVLGDVRSPGRAALSVNTDRILDVIAAVGGPTRPAEDLMVNVRRGDQTYSAPLTLVATEFGENVRLRRGDQVSLTYKPRRFTAFGAVGAVSEQDLGQGALNPDGRPGAPARPGHPVGQSPLGHGVPLRTARGRASPGPDPGGNAQGRAGGLSAEHGRRSGLLHRQQLHDPAGRRGLCAPFGFAEARKFFEFRAVDHPRDLRCLGHERAERQLGPCSVASDAAASTPRPRG